MSLDASPVLLGPVEIRRLAQSHGVVPSKKRGQNFLHDAGTIRKIVRKSEVEPGQVVLEVGPGLGSLTLGLLERGAHVEAVELDRKLAAALPATVTSRGRGWERQLSVIEGDATKLQAGDLPQPPTALVANLPYNVAVPILLQALAEIPSLESALIMVQSEVADRLVADKGSKTYGAPTVKLAWYGQATRAGSVSQDVFWPRPNVGSALVRVRVRPSPRGDDQLRRDTFSLVDAGFSQRRKMLRASLRTVIPNGEEIARILREADIAPDSRPESLDVDSFVALARAWRQ